MPVHALTESGIGVKRLRAPGALCPSRNVRPIPRVAAADLPFRCRQQPAPFPLFDRVCGDAEPRRDFFRPDRITCHGAECRANFPENDCRTMLYTPIVHTGAQSGRTTTRKDTHTCVRRPRHCARRRTARNRGSVRARPITRHISPTERSYQWRRTTDAADRSAECHELVIDPNPAYVHVSISRRRSRRTPRRARTASAPRSTAYIDTPQLTIDVGDRSEVHVYATCDDMEHRHRHTARSHTTAKSDRRRRPRRRRQRPAQHADDMARLGDVRVERARRTRARRAI
jgi:hypothetical protein